MSFRRRNVGVAQPSESDFHPAQSARKPDISEKSLGVSSVSIQAQPRIPGVRPSPLNGRPTTSTGTLSLDGLLAGHSGLALGSSLMFEESGTTDFAGILLKYYAAQGISHGHKVHVVGVQEQWTRELPDVIEQTSSGVNGETNKSDDKDVMKIAWRYERFGDFGSGTHSPIATAHPTHHLHQSPSGKSPEISPSIFCHSFDLTKRLTIPSNSVNLIPILPIDHLSSPFSTIIQNLKSHLCSSPPDTIHRLVIPTLLSPLIYPSHASDPSHILQFLHSLRALLRQHSTQLTAMITLPLMLYPRATGLTRWMEILVDGILELTPFPHTTTPIVASDPSTGKEDKLQGLIKIHRLPVFSEKGGSVTGNSRLGDDLAFALSRKKFSIRPLHLPPLDAETKAVEAGDDRSLMKENLEF